MATSVEIVVALKDESQISNDMVDVGIWGKSIATVAPNKPGGWGIEGEFLPTQLIENQRTGSYSLNFDDKAGRYARNVLMFCVTFTSGLTGKRRAVFVLLPEQLKSHLAGSRFPNDVAMPRSKGIRYATSASVADISVRVDSTKYVMACLIEHEVSKRKNTFDAVVELLTSDINKSSPYYKIDTKSKLARTKDKPITTSTAGVNAVPNRHGDYEVYGLIPIKGKEPVDENGKMSITLSNWYLDLEGKKHYLPEGVFTAGNNADGIMTLVTNNELHMMHILADYENVGKELREFMVKQAELLEAFAATYRLVATMGSEDEDHT